MTEKFTQHNNIVCPDKPKLRARYATVAQVLTATGDLRCHACGADHTTGKSAHNILLDIRQHLLAQGVHLQ